MILINALLLIGSYQRNKQQTCLYSHSFLNDMNKMNITNNINNINNINDYGLFIQQKSDSSNSGLDMRYIENTSQLEDEYININKHFHNMILLNTLSSNKIHNYTKIELIKQNDILKDSVSPNILAGGLLDDFNFEI